MRYFIEWLAGVSGAYAFGWALGYVLHRVNERGMTNRADDPASCAA